ncbi:type VI secretion system lipoprotein TssJ [Rhizobium calliandrae]|uniref:Type VI secretion system lipoprotein TssJ n=1 Tax=Rhizobium calliandrae TaxID=1312182 RepID=A0ABT7KNP4_9HYPH|nr:type VI secretion system lipoprotein TssJ [Rhizobium calliandrae]MDL2408863.1 type VI secretion system lipoprotein TssJ [Rhizobium calliandrae]
MSFKRVTFVGIALFGLVGVLSACGGIPKPTPVAVTINADAAINPSETGVASPVVVRVYELKSLKAFNNATYFDFDEEAKLLGADLISSREFEMLPGTERKYDREISSEAAYIGVVASFRDLLSAQWRDSIELKKETQNRLIIYVTSLAVKIQKYSRFSFGS